MKSDKYMNLSYLLTLNLIFLIKGSAAGLYARLNGVSMTYSLVSAMTGEKRRKRSGAELREKMELIHELIDIKRRTYYPSLEPSHENAEYTAEDRAPFEAEMYEIVTELLMIIEDEGLISQEAIGEAWASSFSGSEGK